MDKILKYFSIISVSLIFLGYWDLHYYYIYFDIPIYNFVTTGELILSFLPSSIYIIIFLLIITFFFILDTQNGEPIRYPKLSECFKVIFKKEGLEKGITFKNVRTLIFSAFIILIKISLLILIIYSSIKHILFLKNSDVYVFKNSIVYISLIIIWAFIFMDILDKVIEKKYEKEKKRSMHIYIRISLLILTFVAINTFTNFRKALQTLNNYPTYEIQFDYFEGKIVSKDNFVFVGITDEYIFLRDLQKGDNKIYNKSDAKNLTMHKLNYNWNISNER